MRFYHPLLALALVVGTSARAVEIQSVEVMTDPEIEAFAQESAEAAQYHGGDSEFVLARLEWASVGEDESDREIVEQAIRWERSKDRFSEPEFLDVKALAKNAQGVREGIRAMLGEVKHDSDAIQPLVGKLSSRLNEILAHQPAVEIFKARDGNSFGRCSTLVIYDGHAMQTLLAQSCWSE